MTRGLLFGLTLSALLSLNIVFPRQKNEIIIDNTPVATNGVFYDDSTPKPTKTPKPVATEKPSKAENFISWKVTAYCPCKKCSGKYGRSTATGKTAKAGRTVAIDPSIVKYGSKVVIDNHTYIAEDCGGAVKGYHVDIFFNTHEEVESFGKQYKRVKILK